MELTVLFFQVALADMGKILLAQKRIAFVL
jgi:hypothetical protein